MEKRPFKLSIITDEVSQDLEKVARFAQRFNLEALELRTIWNKQPHQLLKEVRKIKEVLNKYDLQVSAIASPFFKCDINREEEYRQHINILKRCIELAKSLDTNIVRGFTFWRIGKYEEYENRILELFNKPLEIVESEGVILAIENEPATFVTNGKLLARFLRGIKSRNVKALWDPGNDIWDPYGEIPYPEGYNYVKEWIVHVHLKDAKRRNDEVEPVAFGEGEVDYIGQLKALKKSGYKGYLSMETHWRPGRQLEEELLVKPGGAAFSEAGEEASEICMRRLISILKRI